MSYYEFMCLQLLVGSEDFDIRVFKEDELVSEMTENEVNGSSALHSVQACSLSMIFICTDNILCCIIIIIIMHWQQWRIVDCNTHFVLD